MNEALKEAQKAFEKDEVPVGAVIVCRNQVIARSYNMTEELNDVTAHAEMLAITRQRITWEVNTSMNARFSSPSNHV